MVEVRRSPAAEADLIAILEYGASRWGRDDALDFVLDFKTVYDLLATYPEIGRDRPELRMPIRSWHHRGYVVYYRFDGTNILVLRVMHGAADVGSIIDWQ